MKQPEMTPELLEKLKRIREEAIEKNSPQSIIRGIEIVRWTGAEWAVNSRFRPTELALSQARNELKWLQERYPFDMYELRTVVSLRAPTETVVKAEPEQPADGIPSSPQEACEEYCPGNSTPTEQKEEA